LKPGELDDLVEFLKSLPYEQPPDETPNTVKYRFTTKGKNSKIEIRNPKQMASPKVH